MKGKTTRLIGGRNPKQKKEEQALKGKITRLSGFRNPKQKEEDQALKVKITGLSGFRNPKQKEEDQDRWAQSTTMWDPYIGVRSRGRLRKR